MKFPTLLKRIHAAMEEQNRIPEPHVENRVRLSRFGAAVGLLFSGRSGSVEVALAPLEVKRILQAWADWELVKEDSDTDTLRALHFLIEKTYEKAPRFIAEAPFASCGRASITPDLEFQQSKQLPDVGAQHEKA